MAARSSQVWDPGLNPWSPWRIRRAEGLRFENFGNKQLIQKGDTERLVDVKVKTASGYLV